jgi:hypothetical protein
VKWLKRLFGKLKSTKTEEAPAAAPPAAASPATQVEKPTPEPVESDSAAETPAEAEIAAEPPKAEPVAESPEAEPAAKPEPVTESAAEADAELAKTEPVSEPEAAPEATDPALSTLDAAELQPAAEEGPFGPGSAKPLADGAAPGEEFTVKGKRSSKLFHTAESPYFGRTKADVWFKTPADAESAGFAAWNHKKKAAASK